MVKKILFVHLVLLLCLSSVVAQTVLVDFGTVLSSTTSPNSWNNITSNTVGTMVNLVDASNNSTGYSLNISTAFAGANATGATTTTAPASTIFPGTTTNDCFWNQSGNFSTIVFSGLNSNYVYSFDVIGSRVNSTPLTDNRETKYTFTGSNSGSGLLDAANNSGNYVTISNISPDVNGKITLKIELGPNNTNTTKYIYLSALRMTGSLAQTTSSFTYVSTGRLVAFTSTSTNASSYSWDFGDGTTAAIANPTHTYSLPGTYNVSLTVTGQTVVNSNQNITVVSLTPTAAFSYTKNSLSVLFTNSSTNATSYSWDFGDGSTSTQASPNHSYLSVGNYNVILTATSADGSVATNTQTVTVDASPTVDYTYTANGLSVTFTNTSTNATSYSWNFGDGTATSSTTSPSHTFASAGSYTVVLTATNAAGSSQKSVLINVIAASTTETIYIDFGGTSTPSGNWNNLQAFSSTTPVNLTNDQGIASNISLAINKVFGGINYNGTTSPTGNAATVFSASSGNATSDSFYSTGNTASSGFILSGLNATKQYSFDIFASRTSVADNREAKYTFTGQNTVFTTLNAANNTGNVATVSGVSPDAAGKITFLMEKGANNTESTSGYIYLGAMRITSTVSTTPPTASYTYVSTGLTVNFTNTSLNATSYSWDFGDGSPLSTSTSPSHTYATEGNYTVVLTATSTNGISSYNQNIAVIQAIPVTNFTYSVSDKTVTFSNTSLNATSCSWNFGDGSTSTQTSPTHLYGAYGDYNVQLTATNSKGSNTTTKTITISQKVIKKILFLGNSYVFSVNPLNIPQVLQKVAASMGDSVYFASNSYPAASFQTHVNTPADMDSIRLGKWDFVSMNDYSRQAAFPPTVFDDPITGDFHYAKMLTDSIVKYNPCGQPMFYMSWGWPAGDASYCSIDPGVCTFKGMDDRAQANYMYLGTQINAIINPVGTVRRQFMDDYNKYLPDGLNAKMDLFSDYNGHPTALASYFSACCFYTAMFRKDPTLITYNYNLPADTAAIVRSEVKKVLYNNLLTYNIGKFDPVANFSYVTNGQNLTFTNTSTNANSYSWDFGDGVTSSATNPTHNFVGNGPFTVKLTAQKCNISDTKTITIDFTTTGIENNNSQSNTLSCYPNPVTGELTLNTCNQPINSIKIYNSLGKMMILNQQLVGNNVVIDFSKIGSGIYLVKVEANGKITSKVITKK